MKQDQILQQLSKRLTPLGFDIIEPFSVNTYNNLFISDSNKTHLLLPTFSRHDSLGVLIGNTRRLWKPFIEKYASDPVLSTSPHPLNEYSVSSINKALTELSIPSEVRYGHHMTREGKPTVAMQHAAHVAQFAHYDNQVSFLSYHPEYGTWFALRAVVVFQTEHDLGELLQTNVQAHNMTDQTKRELQEFIDTATTWKDWLRMRDVATLGLLDGESIQQKWRYGPNQLQYHYTRNHSFLCHDDHAD